MSFALLLVACAGPPEAIGKPSVTRGQATLGEASAEITGSVSVKLRPLVEVIAINVNSTEWQGDSILVLGPGAEGKTLLIDGGYYDEGRDSVIPYLLSRNITHLDYMVATHADMDHIAGLIEVLSERRVTVAELLVPNINWRKIDSDDEDYYSIVRPVWDDLMSAATHAGVPIRVVFAGDQIDLGPDAVADVLHGWESPTWQHNSLVLRIKYHDRAALLPGDASAGVWEWLGARDYDLSADVLKLPHHCDAETGVIAYLDAIDPALGIAPVPARVLTEPKCTVMKDALEASGAVWLSNSEHGHITAWLRFGGVTWASGTVVSEQAAPASLE